MKKQNGNGPVYLRLEVPEPTKVKAIPDGRYVYIEVLPEHLPRLTAAELFERSFDRDTRNARHTFRRIMTADPAQRTDMRPLEESLSGILEQCRAALESYGPAGTMVAEAVLPAFDLAPVLQSVVTQRLGEADEQLQVLLYTLLSGITKLANHIHVLDIRAEGHAAHAEHLERTVATGDDEFLQKFIAWGEAAENVIDADAGLREIEEQLGAAVKAHESAETAVAWELRADLPVFRDLQTMLLDADDAFLIAAHNALVAGRIPPELHTAIPAVREMTEAVRTLEQSRQGVLDASKRRVASIRLDAALMSRQQGLLMKLRTAIVRLNEYEANRNGGARPYEHRLTNTLMTEECYHRAVAIARNDERSPTAVTRRFEALDQRLSRASNATVSLPATIGADLEKAEDYLRQLDVLLHGDVPVIPAALPVALTPAIPARTPAKPAPAPAPPVGRPAPAVIRFTPGQSSTIDARRTAQTVTAPVSAPAPSRTVDAATLERLYELLCCCGYAVTYDPGTFRFMRVSTVEAMLETLVRAGACTSAEAKAAFPELHARAVAESETWGHDKGTRLAERWAYTPKRWIHYQAGAKKHLDEGEVSDALWKFKFTAQSKALAIELLKRHGLTVDRLQSGRIKGKQAKSRTRRRRRTA